jgi:uncharacterized protein with PIN domain
MANHTSSNQRRRTVTQRQPKKLLVNGMLGRLARWLRILGYDTAFEPKADDWTLVHLARAEGRLLLTRDRQLASQRVVSALLIENEELAAQVQQVVTAVGPSPTGTFSRCPICNRRLAPLSHDEARGRVPPHVYRTQQEFRLCPECDRVYWQGSHWERMREILADWQDLTLTGNQSIMQVNPARDPSADREV